MTDPRKAQTLGEACDNGDGTFNGLKALSWLSEVMNPGKGLPLTEVEKIAEEVKARKAAQDNARNKIWALEGYLLREKLSNG